MVNVLMRYEVLSAIIAVLSFFYVAYLWSCGLKNRIQGQRKCGKSQMRFGKAPTLSSAASNKTIAILSVVFGFVLLVAYGLLGNDWNKGIQTAIAFWFGAFCSGIAGVIGMKVAVQANIRTASAAPQRDEPRLTCRPFVVVPFPVLLSLP